MELYPTTLMFFKTCDDFLLENIIHKKINTQSK